MSTIYEAALEYQKLMEFEYKFVFGYKRKATEIPLRFSAADFFHLSGLQYINDDPKIKEAANSIDVFEKIIKKEIVHEEFVSDRGFIEHNIQDRINRVADLPRLLNIAAREGRLEVYKYNKKANPNSDIDGNFIIKSLAPDNRFEYFILREDRYNPQCNFGLSIFSRDPQLIKEKKQNDFVAGHTHNTLLCLSKTPLKENKELDIIELDINNREVLYKLKSYTIPSDGNITIVKFESPDYNKSDVAALSSTKPILMEKAISIWTSIKEFFADKSTENRRLIKGLQKIVDKYELQLFEKQQQIAANKKEITSLKEENSALTEKVKELEQQKQPVLTSAKSKGSFGDNLVDFADKVRTENAAKSQQQDKPNLKPTDKPKH